jgi:tryptophan synthase alpha chain
MNRIDVAFARLRSERRKALIGYVTAGYPTKESFAAAVPRMVNAGIDILEVGIPFSDPIADGPTIQAASFGALKNGVTLSWIFEQVTALRATVDAPIVFMSYSNPILAMGTSKFFQAAKTSGVDGLIVPDLIPEESALFDEPARKAGVHLIYLIAPTSSKERIRRVAAQSRGFLYAVSVTGVTGARTVLPTGLPDFLKSARQASALPVAVGFGLSTPEQVKGASLHADGVIVGSALIKEMERSQNDDFAGAESFVQSLRQALDETTSPSAEETAHAAG